MRRMRAAVVVIAVALALGGIGAEAQESPEGRPIDAVVTAVERIDDRMVDLTVDSPSVGVVGVRLLLPASFDDEPDRTWPVLFLLHGATDDHTTWTTRTDVVELTEDTDLLVVMPDGGEWGWYSDWWNGGEGGPPAWETFHVTELLRVLERDWRAGEERLVAGNSMGGFGAMHYAQAHPELFGAAASISGAVDPVGSRFPDDFMLWGSPEAQADVWAAHDTVDMADALAGKTLYVSWNDGQPGPLDTAEATFDDIEQWMAESGEVFVDRLEDLGIPVTVDVGQGTHTWPYFERSLHAALPALLESLEE